MTGSSKGENKGEASTASLPSARVRSWMGGKKSRHKHLEMIVSAAKGVVIWLAVSVVSLILFSTQPQGFARVVFAFVALQAGNMALLTIVRYYRTAIMAGALKKKSHDTARGTGELSGEVSNSSVVPVASASNSGVVRD